MGGCAGDFEDEWPQLASRLRATLSARGIGSWQRDDIVQETGLRLFKMWDRVDPTRSPCGLTLKIANNLLWDHAHDKERSEIVGSVPDLQDDHDTERAALARMELTRVRRALPLLSASHRSVLLAEIGYPSSLTGRSYAAIKVLRMRARRQLAALMDQASTFGVTLSWNVRHFGWRGLEPVKRAALTTNLVPGEAQVHAVAAGMLAVASLLALPSPDAAVPGPSGSSSADSLLVLHERGSVMEAGAPPSLRLGDQRLATMVDRKLREARDSQNEAPKYRTAVGDGGPAQGEAEPRLLADPNQWVQDKKHSVEDRVQDKRQSVEDKQRSAEDKVEDKKQSVEDKKQGAEDKVEDKKQSVEDKLP